MRKVITPRQWKKFKPVVRLNTSRSWPIWSEKQGRLGAWVGTLSPFIILAFILLSVALIAEFHELDAFVSCPELNE